MPELPEVEVVRRGLETHVVGATIGSVVVLHERPVRSYAGGPAGFADALSGRRVVAARRRGKYLWLALDDAETGDALTIHLGMSGQMLVQPPEAAAERHLRARFPLRRLPPPLPSSPGSPAAEPGVELRFVDQRMFGGLGISPGGASIPPEIAHIAPDPLEEAFDADRVVARMRRSSSGIKRLLLTQTVISGVGNIYADEALWRAAVHGERPGNRLTKPALHRVLGAATEVMREALAQGGTSFDALYVNVNGQSGYFDRSLNAYGQEGRACGRCGTPIRRVQFMNRSSYFCPVCQPAPRARR